MQARRLLLVLAVLLLLSAGASSLVAPPDERSEAPPTEPAEPPPAPPPDRNGGARKIEMVVDGRGGRRRPGARPQEGPAEGEPRRRPPVEAVGLREHVILTVEASEPGEVELRGLGRVEPVGPRAAAVFDLFTDVRGDFDVVYRPVDGSERHVGRLVVGDPPPGDAAGGTGSRGGPRSPAAAGALT